MRRALEVPFSGVVGVRIGRGVWREENGHVDRRWRSQKVVRFFEGVVAGEMGGQLN